jgi:hypothetical protein
VVIRLIQDWKKSEKKRRERKEATIGPTTETGVTRDEMNVMIDTEEMIVTRETTTDTDAMTETTDTEERTGIVGRKTEVVIAIVMIETGVAMIGMMNIAVEMTEVTIETEEMTETEVTIEIEEMTEAMIEIEEMTEAMIEIEETTEVMIETEEMTEVTIEIGEMIAKMTKETSVMTKEAETSCLASDRRRRRARLSRARS